MIDFRYHLVSIVAVFLALAIGIVLGSTELQGNTIDVLRSSSNSLKNQLDQAQAERGVAQAQVATNQTFLTTAEPRLLANELPGDRIVLITEPGASSTVISGVKQAAAVRRRHRDRPGVDPAEVQRPVRHHRVQPGPDQLRSGVDRQHLPGHALQRADRSTSSRPRS